MRVPGSSHGRDSVCTQQRQSRMFCRGFVSVLSANGRSYSCCCLSTCKAGRILQPFPSRSFFSVDANFNGDQEVECGEVDFVWVQMVKPGCFH